MPTASFSRDLILSTSREEVWDAVTDVGRLVGWVSILHDAKEIEPLASYTATLQDRLGPFKLRAELDITVPEHETGRRVVLRAEGEDRQVSSRISVSADVRLEDHDGGTRFAVDGTYEVAGRVATMGASMIRNKADKVIEEFFGRLGEELR